VNGEVEDEEMKTLFDADDVSGIRQFCDEDGVVEVGDTSGCCKLYVSTGEPLLVLTVPPWIGPLESDVTDTW
jgi:hypothetical protein